MMAETFRWWLAIEAIGLVALPLTLLLFRSLPGRGYAFAKPLGLLLIGYLFWLTLTLHVLPNRPGSIVWVMLVVLLVDYFILRRRWAELWRAILERRGFVIACEIVFFAGLFVAGHIKSQIPEIQATEKPMDFMFLNAASRSTYYPPDDAWLAGYGVSYYYFGYVISAMLGKLAAVSTSVAFNLALAGTAALAATAAFGLAYEIAMSARRAAFRTAVVVGVGAIALVTLMGNLEGVLEFGAANDALPQSVVDAVDIANLEDARESHSCLAPVLCMKYPTDSSDFWWWWRATRISPDAGTITEFPFFSFILGDLHPHVIAIPFVLLAFGLGLSLWRNEAALNLGSWRRAPPLLLLSSIVVGGLAFLNTWDLPTFGFLIALLVLARNAMSQRDLFESLGDSVAFLAPLAGLALVLYAPFYVSFSSQAGFVDAVTNGATRPVQSVLFWAPLLALSLPLPLYLLLMDPEAFRGRRILLSAALPVALMVLWVLLIVVRHGAGDVGHAISARGWNWLTPMVFGGALVTTMLALWAALTSPPGPLSPRGPGDPEVEGSASQAASSSWASSPLLARSGVGGEVAATVPVLAAMTAALLLIFGAEFFFVTDVFGSRLNTVFKFYYQAWLLLGVSAAAAAWLFVDQLKRESSPALRTLQRGWVGLAGLVVAAALLYSLGAILSRTDGLSRGPRTLDGLAYVDNTPMASDLHLAEWLRANAGQHERIVEAPGGQYSSGSRVSAWSGVPTVLGWRGHEKQWGRNDATLAQREAAVETVYKTTSLEEALAILQQYGVTYIVVGTIERQTYPPGGLQKFEGGLQSVVSSGNSMLYRLPPTQPAETTGIGADR
jgi:YYY domain-containing protein